MPHSHTSWEGSGNENWKMSLRWLDVASFFLFQWVLHLKIVTTSIRKSVGTWLMMVSVFSSFPEWKKNVHGAADFAARKGVSILTRCLLVLNITSDCTTVAPLLSGHLRDFAWCSLDKGCPMNRGLIDSKYVKYRDRRTRCPFNKGITVIWLHGNLWRVKTKKWRKRRRRMRRRWLKGERRTS